MIIRTWHGWTTTVDADAYARLLDEDVIPGILSRRIPGLRGVDVLRGRADARPTPTSDEPASVAGVDGADEEVEFVTIMTFDDWAAVEAFAGPDGTASVVPLAARRLLRRFDSRSQHFDRLARRAP